MDPVLLGFMIGAGVLVLLAAADVSVEPRNGNSGDLYG